MVWEPVKGWAEYDPDFIFLKRERRFLKMCLTLLSHLDSPNDILYLDQDQNIDPNQLEKDMGQLLISYKLLTENDGLRDLLGEDSYRDSKIDYIKKRATNTVRILETLFAIHDSDIAYDSLITIDTLIVHFSQVLNGFYYSSHWNDLKDTVFLAIQQSHIFDLFRSCANSCHQFALKVKYPIDEIPSDKQELRLSTASDLFYTAYQLFHAAERMMLEIPDISSDSGLDNWVNQQAIQESSITSAQCYTQAVTDEDEEETTRRFYDLYERSKRLLHDIQVIQPLNSQNKPILLARTHFNVAITAYLCGKFNDFESHAQAAIDYFCFVHRELRDCVESATFLDLDLEEIDIKYTDLIKVVHLVEMLNQFTDGNQYSLEG